MKTTFLHLQIDNDMNWKNHIVEMIPKLSAACYAIRLMVHTSNTLKSIYYAYFHCIIKYGTVFWGNSFNSEKIFTLLKKKVHNPEPHVRVC